MGHPEHDIPHTATPQVDNKVGLSINEGVIMQDARIQRHGKRALLILTMFGAGVFGTYLAATSAADTWHSTVKTYDQIHEWVDTHRE